MSLTTFFVLSLAIAACVGLVASLLLRAWLKKPEPREADKNDEMERPEPSDGHGALK